jgi:hypothetical protein
VQLRFYEELNDFLPPERRKIAFTHALTRRTSVKDLIESCGVPHTEVELILANGRKHPGAELGFLLASSDFTATCGLCVTMSYNEWILEKPDGHLDDTS